MNRMRFRRTVALFIGAAAVSATVIGTSGPAAAGRGQAGGPGGEAVDGPSPAVMHRQDQLLNAVEALRPLFHAHPNNYGGLVIDAAAGTVTVYWLGTPPAELARTAAAHISGGELRLIVRPATYAFAKLHERAQHLVGQQVDGRRVVLAAPLPDATGIKVRVDGPIKAETVRAQLGPDVTEVVVGPAPVASSRWADTAPFWGGNVITSPTRGDTCSGAFGVHKLTGGKMLLTAGHCGSVGDKWQTPAGTNVGTTSTRYKAYEAELIPADTGSYVFYGGVDQSGGGSGESHRHVSGLFGAVNGTFVCADGGFSGAVCNNKVTNDAISYELQEFDGLVVVGDGEEAEQQAHTGAEGNGDSGGPVVADVTSTTVKGAGVISAIDSSTKATCHGVPADSSRSCAWRWYFAALGQIEQAAGVTLNN